MSKLNDKKSGASATKKWLTLGVAAMALLLIPRRSSRQDMSNAEDLAATDDLKSPDDSSKNAHNN